MSDNTSPRRSARIARNPRPNYAESNRTWRKYCITGCYRPFYRLMIRCWNFQTCTGGCAGVKYHPECVGLDRQAIPGEGDSWYCPDCRERLGVDVSGEPVANSKGKGIGGASVEQSEPSRESRLERGDELEQGTKQVKRENKAKVKGNKKGGVRKRGGRKKRASKK
ncbi:hypothetical protein QBC46DRAFT_342932 [Diplogelasinospora grovesii]|uniref:PHD-type domain-containing protein n=1 Tax=Diplogelasinospora grovesii TaxID=303347 RepID=A0AAN6N698_9PEZI|nr:hypothetical protein QBC46DRAFT_342932 [Diplogelasinospora grovesii]